MTSVYIQTAKQVFEIEANALNALSERLDSDFDDAVKTILDAKGKVIICGMGKSGIIGKKIAATLASTGTPSFFMHPGEAYHGDLGMVTSDDVFVAISNSGETDEVVKLIPFLKDNNNYLVALTGNAKSTLATAANAHLDVGVAEEACPLQLAPTSSTTATLAMGDALAVTLMKARDFKPENFARFHPGGSLGRRLLSRVEDEMVSTDLPFVSVNSSLLDVIQTMSAGRLGLAIIKDVDGYAMITDGDVRRLIEQYKEAAFSKVASDFMSLNPAQVPLGTRVEDALALVESRKITSLLITDKNSVVGVFKK
ncbi:KpsF/GutQ family sugar-phosphate isomerase [Neptunomonas phycophila]|uniref:KpsF/GutQ family sugar-phosphate isomerase n=1 Tax=Neptunomonas phycophila TaxID=1572645 RepID=UPI0030F53255